MATARSKKLFDCRCADETRAALAWVYDRITVDGGMTAKERAATAEEIAKVLRGQESKAATYKPNDWDPSALMASVYSLRPRAADAARLKAASPARPSYDEQVALLRLADDIEGGEISDLDTAQSQLVVRSLRAAASPASGHVDIVFASPASADAAQK